MQHTLLAIDDVSLPLRKNVCLYLSKLAVRPEPVLAPSTFGSGEPEDRSIRGLNGRYDQVHLGVGAASFGNVCVGLYGLWHNAHFDKAFDDISCDFGLLVSNDGVHFREPVKPRRSGKAKRPPAFPSRARESPRAAAVCGLSEILNPAGTQHGME
jgi:hypothetical protein